MKYLELEITKSSKSRNGKQKYGIYDEEKIIFKNMQEVKDFLKENYKCKRSKTYRDDKNGNAIPCGYAYSFINQDEEGKEYIEEHWVDLWKIEKNYIPLHR